MSERLTRAVSDLRERAPEVPPDLLDPVIRRVRADLRPGNLLAMPCATGSARVTEAAVRDAVIRELDSDGSVLVLECHVRADADGAGVPATVRVELAVSARWAAYDTGSPAHVRERTAGALLRLFGLRVALIDIDVRDVTDVPA